MVHNPNSPPTNTDAGHTSGQLGIHLVDLDFVDSAIMQAEISLIEHYFQDILIDLTKGLPP